MKTDTKIEVTELQAKIDAIENASGKGSFFTPLEEEVSKRIKTDVTFPSIEFQKTCVRLTSLNIVEKAGIMASVFSELHVITFGSDYNSENGTLWLSINFSWEMKNGGSNGTAILSAWYDFNDNEWSFR